MTVVVKNNLPVLSTRYGDPAGRCWARYDRTLTVGLRRFKYRGISEHLTIAIAAAAAAATLIEAAW